ncbi:MAG: hypothetical protein Q8807_02285 ['Waltheria sp.' little leaf phytoplasma]|nr:hypothetical protein ['Waltheria sp.' little leaf phytoplasma]
MKEAFDNYQDLGYDFIAYVALIIKSENRELIRNSHSSLCFSNNHKKDNFFKKNFMRYIIS